MTALTYDGAHRRSRVATFAAATKRTVVRTTRRFVAPHKVALANLKAIPLTVVGTGLIDFSAFYLGNGWGWLVTGVSCIAVEYVIADEDQT